MANEKFSVTYHQGLEQVSWFLRLNKIRMTINFDKFEKKIQFYQTIAKIRDFKMLKPIGLRIETMKPPFIKPIRRFFEP